MTHITFTISDIQKLNSIKAQLSNKRPLTAVEQEYLLHFLTQVPTPDARLLKDIATEEPIRVMAWDVAEIEEILQKWKQLFYDLPGFDHSPSADIVDLHGNPDWFHQNIIMVVTFSPTLSHNEFECKEPFEVRLKDDGTALFWFPTCDDSRNYPELYNFGGTWKEAYLLLIETLKRGWPMEEFPEELRPFLKK